MPIYVSPRRLRHSNVTTCVQMNYTRFLSRNKIQYFIHVYARYYNIFEDEPRRDAEPVL